MAVNVCLEDVLLITGDEEVITTKVNKVATCRTEKRSLEK